jgi:choline dehydrogenase-like flavoprotein
MTPDVIVVGSGPGGANAAAALVQAGRRVLMLDYGITDDRYAPRMPRAPFSELRRSDPEQHRYLLGERFEGVPLGGVRVGAQLTPPRLHVFAESAERVPVESESFQGAPSFARGGFGAAWAAGVFPFVEEELRDMGLGQAELQPHYDAVAERIGVSGGNDDLARFFPPSPSLMPPLELDSSAEAILGRYQRARQRLNSAGFFLGGTRLAVSTREHRGRGPEAYLDMAYWADFDRSVYRPQWTLDELSESPNFAYRPGCFVQSFEEPGAGVRVHLRRVGDGAAECVEARALVLAAGTLGSAWIVLRSLGRYDAPVPILCNPYAYTPMLNLGTWGRAVRDRRHSLAQLTCMASNPGGARSVQAQIFSYRSLLTFKLMKESPFAHRENLRLMRLLIPHFAILGVHHEDRPTAGKRLQLRRGEPDRLRIDYAPDVAELAAHRADERALKRTFLRLGCIPLMTIRPGHGANIHYAGTFPMGQEGGELSCDRSGRLRATRAVYLADGSVFPWLPAKGLTFTLMALANRTGTLLAERLA